MPAASTITAATRTTAAPANRPQHLRALDYANEVRLARAQLKRDVRAGLTGAAEVVRGCPWEAETMTVGELLRSQSRWGRTRTRKFLMPLAVNENREIGRLTQRQRDELAAALDAKSRLAAMPAPSVHSPRPVSGATAQIEVAA
jgi:hypothetical protein